MLNLKNTIFDGHQNRFCDCERKERLSKSLWVLGGGLWERNSGEPSDYESLLILSAKPLFPSRYTSTALLAQYHHVTTGAPKLPIVTFLYTSIELVIFKGFGLKHVYRR